MATAHGNHAVSGCVKKDGSYVAPTVATNPKATKLDNYRTKWRPAKSGDFLRCQPKQLDS